MPEDEQGDFITHPDEAITVDSTEYQAYLNYVLDQSQQSNYGDYHYVYQVFDEEDAAKLEEIAAKYNLVLRADEVLRFEADGTAEELNQELSGACGSGLIYREAPQFDHYTYYSSGSFQSMANIPLSDGRLAYTYFCSTAYNEMVSGDEVGSTIVRSDDTMITRSYTSADGTELTISENSTNATIYAFLDSSYITIQVCINNWRDTSGSFESWVQETDFTLTEDVVNYVADFINYSNIGK